MESLLPRDPELGTAPELQACVRALLEHQRAGQAGRLPPLAGLPRLVVARWLYRAWLRRQASWAALVHVDPRFVDRGHQDRILDDAAEQAAGGWLFIDAGWSELWDEERLLFAARSRALQLVLASEGEVVAIPGDVRSRLERLNRFHLVAVDPSIASQRRGVLAYCKARSILHLHGPPGTGKRSLAHWANTELGLAPPVHFRAGHERSGPVPQRWQVFEEPGQLEPGQIQRLRDHLSLSDEDFSISWLGARADIPPRPDDPAFDAIVGNSAALRRVLAKAERFGKTSLPILIRGETGSGKELVAQAIHDVSRRQGRFVAIDLSSRSESLIESALFGHVKGAFTGAHTSRQGAIAEAHGGTLFLDELGNLSLAIQSKLLRVMERNEVQPVGSDRIEKVDVRIVAATNADLEATVREGDFREDLLYRFNPAATLWLPPLRERGDDIVPLSRHFLEKLAGDRPAEITDAALSRLRAWSWPGNVRELRHVVEAAWVEAEGQAISVGHLGSLSGEGPRAFPVLVISSDAPSERTSWKLTRNEIQQIVAVTVSLAPLTQRSSSCIRSAVLSLLGGRPICRNALRVLERHTWWGNFTELWRALETICGNIEGSIDVIKLQRQVPGLVVGASVAPIRFLLFPTVHRSTRIAAFERRFDEGAVLIGRARSFHELEPAEDSGDRRVRVRWESIQALLGTSIPGFMPLEFRSRLSRAHAIVLRDRNGLVVHALPGTSLPVLAGPLDDSGLFNVEIDRPVEIGQAGEIRFIDERKGKAEIYLQLFVFSGVDPNDLAADVEERLGSTETLTTSGIPEERIRVWQVNPEEAEALSDLVVASLTSRRPFAKGIRSAVRHWATGQRGLWRLGEYLDSSHPTQSCTRLIAYPDNQLLREKLCSKIAQLQKPAEAWVQLPSGIRKVVPAPDERAA